MNLLTPVYNYESRAKLHDLAYLKAQLSIHGYLKLEGFSHLKDFLDFTNRLGIQYRPYHGAGIEREKVLGDPTLLNVNHPDDFGGSTLHGEQYYLKTPPSIIFFYCNTQAQVGGETLTCNGIELLNALPDELRDKLTHQPIIYQRHFSAEQWSIMMTSNPGFTRNWQIVPQMDGSIKTEFKTQSVWPAPNGQLAFINSILPILFDFGKYSEETMSIVFSDGTLLDKEMGQQILDAANKVQEKILLQEHEGIVVDNSWILHGRMPFSGKREMFTRMSLESIDLR